MMKAENAGQPGRMDNASQHNPPQVHVHHTTTTTSPAVTLDWIKFDFEYFKTIPGILKIVQFIFAIFCMGFAAPAYYGGTHFFLFVVVTAFLVTAFWICIYFLCIREALTLKIPWLVLEFYYTVGATVFYFIAMIVQFAIASGYSDSGITAACFGLFNTIAYGAGAFFLFQDWRQGGGSSDANNAPNLP